MTWHVNNSITCTFLRVTLYHYHPPDEMFNSATNHSSPAPTLVASRTRGWEDRRHRALPHWLAAVAGVKCVNQCKKAKCRSVIAMEWMEWCWMAENVKIECPTVIRSDKRRTCGSEKAPLHKPLCRVLGKNDEWHGTPGFVPFSHPGDAFSTCQSHS